MTALLIVLAWGLVLGDGEGGPSPVLGHWVGKLAIGPPTGLTIVLHVDPGDEGGLTGRLDSPDQGAFGLEVASIRLDDEVLRFECPTIGVDFSGTLAEDGQSLSGTFTQRGRETPLTLTRTAEADLPRPVEPPEELLGLWQGPIEIPGGISLRVALRVEPVEERPGERTAVLDSIDQGVKGIPVSAISLAGETVRFELKSIGGSFEGTLNEAGTSIAGRWKQGGLNTPLTLERVEAVSDVKRPQHPEPPFPYRVEEVTFENEAAGLTLAGTLTIPEGNGPFPGAVLISGSGPQDRDETLLGHKPFLVIADHLTKAGIAVLRFDDRGVGQSGGVFESATTEDFASDALAALRTLRARAEVDGKAVGLIGHSEGGVVAPMVAVEAPEDVAFLVLLAGTGVPGRELVLRQIELIARAGGASEPEIASQLRAVETLLERSIAGKRDEATSEEVEALAREAVAALEVEDRKALEESAAAVSATISQLPGPWFRAFLIHDPRPVLERVSCPVLALFGELDLQVEPEQNAPEVERALRTGGNDRATIEVLPGLNHLFQHAETGSPAEYGAIEETFAPEALNRLSGWIRETTERD